MRLNRPKRMMPPYRISILNYRYTIILSKGFALFHGCPLSSQAPRRSRRNRSTSPLRAAARDGGSLLRSSPDHFAAVGADHLTRDEIDLRRGEERHGVGELARLGVAAERHPGDLS